MDEISSAHKKVTPIAQAFKSDLFMNRRQQEEAQENRSQRQALIAVQRDKRSRKNAVNQNPLARLEESSRLSEMSLALAGAERGKGRKIDAKA
jgi:hypothetical protein